MQIGKSFNGVSKGLLVDLGVFGLDAVADRAIFDGRKV